MPELLVLEVMPANLHGRSLGLELAADRLEIADKLALLGVHADHRLTRRDRLADRLVDVRKLRVTVGVLGALPGLLVRLQAVPLRLQQPQHGAVNDVVAHLPQRLGELRAALRRPPQRRFRIPPGDRIDQSLQILREPRLTLQDRRAPRMSAHLPRPRHLTGLQITQAPQHRRL